MNNYKAKLQELNLSEASVSEKIRKEIKVHEEAVVEYNQLQSELSGMEQGDADYDEKMDEVAEIVENLNEHDDELIKLIEIYAANKPMYQEKMKKLSDARIAKAQAKSQNPAPAPVAAPVAAPIAAPVVAAPVVIEDKKESSNSGLFWGAVTLVLAIIGVQHFKNK